MSNGIFPTLTAPNAAECRSLGAITVRCDQDINSERQF